MHEEIEIEYKSLLTKEEFDNLVKKYLPEASSHHTQTNVYWDTSTHQLQSGETALRIRLLEQAAEVTLKEPVTDGLWETTEKISLAKAKEAIQNQTFPALNNFKDKLAHKYHLSLKELQIIGQLTTTRIEIPITKDALLVLDESWYHGHHDFELEMEVSNAQTGRPFFLDFLTQNQLIYRPAANKIARAILAQKEQ